MAAPLDRTWYNTLIDDDGSGTVGTIWNKGQIDGLLDTVDASLAGLVDTAGSYTQTGLTTFDRDPDAPFAVSPGSAVVPNLDADKVDGLHESAFVLQAGRPAGQNINGASAGVTVQNFNIAAHPGGPLITLWGTTSPGTGRVDIVGAGASGPILLWVAGQQMLQLLPSGLVALPLGKLQFPGAPSPSADATTLDDYREGTFTPFFTGSSGASGQTYSIQEGRYTKIGRIVFVNGRIDTALIGTISGNLRLGGFPFTAIANHQHAIGVSYFNGVASALSSIDLLMMPATTIADVWAVSGAGGTGSVTLGQGNLTNTVSMIFGGFYFSA